MKNSRRVKSFRIFLILSLAALPVGAFLNCGPSQNLQNANERGTSVSRLFASPWSGIIAPSRATDWSQAGVTGGIPNRTNICSTLTSTATTAQINSAISSCSSSGGGVVLLTAGTYSNVTSGICMKASNVTLRGAGANQTFLAPTSGSSCGGGSIGMSGGGIVGGGAISGDASQGSNIITVATGATSLVVGNQIIFDQLDLPCDNGGVFESGTGSGYTCTATSPGIGGPYSTDGGANGVLGSGCSSSSPSSCYHQQQFSTVTSCNGITTPGTTCSGTNVVVGFSPGFQMANWNVASMRAWWVSGPLVASGVEDLSLDSTNNSGAIGIQITDCQGCWVKGIASQKTAESHIQLFHSNNITVENNYFFLTQNTTTVSYGTECFSCGNNLIVNNIFHGVTTPMISNGPAIANVFAYNYTIYEYFTTSSNYSIPARGDHASASQMNLTEGNISNGITADAIHGTSNMETFFRNYESTEPACWTSGSIYATAIYGACTGGITTMQIYSFHRFFNLIGNVLGTTGVNTVYNSGTATNSNVLGIGYGNGGVPNDPNVQATIMLWGNADSATGFGSPRFNASEVPSNLTGVQAPYSNPLPVSHTLPPSFYYSSQPSWWPSSKPWPPIGPDITSGNLLICGSGPYDRALVTSASQCGGGTSSTAVNGLANSNPAMDCYLSLGGLPNGTGAQLTNFNEAICYGSSGVGPTPTPTPPPTATPTPNPSPSPSPSPAVTPTPGPSATPVGPTTTIISPVNGTVVPVSSSTLKSQKLLALSPIVYVTS